MKFLEMKFLGNEIIIDYEIMSTSPIFLIDSPLVVIGIFVTYW